MDRDQDRGNRFYRTHSRSASWTLPRNASGLANTLEPLRTAFVELAGLSSAANSHNTHSGGHSGQSQPATPVYSSTTGPFEPEQVTYPPSTSSTANGSVAHRRTESATSLSSATHHIPVAASSLTNAPSRSASSPNFEYETVSVESREQSNEGEETGVEVRLAVRWLQRSVPFLLLFLLKVFWDHRLGFCVFVGLWFMFAQTNRLIKQQVALQDRRQLFEVLKVIVFLTGNIFFIYYVFHSNQLYKCLIFQRPYLYLDVWNIMWTVGITDFIVRFLTMVLKCIILCLCKQCLPARKKGKYYMLLEQTSQCYRMLIPVTIWVSFFFAYYDKVSFLLAVIFVVLYALLKGSTVYEKLKELKAAVAAFRQDRQYGVRPSKEQLATADGSCPICQDDLTEPIALHCKHIFCEACIAMWFDRERTCPLCRAAVSVDPLWRDGSTTMAMQIF